MSNSTTEQHANPKIKYVIKDKLPIKVKFPLVPLMLGVIISLNVYSLSNENKIINILNTHSTALSSLTIQIQGVYTAYTEIKESITKDLDQKIAKEFKRIAYGKFINKKAKSKKAAKIEKIVPKIVKEEKKQVVTLPVSQVAIEEQLNDIETRELEIMNTVFNSPNSTQEKKPSETQTQSQKDNSFKKAHQLYSQRVVESED